MDQTTSENNKQPIPSAAQPWQATFDAIQDAIFVLDKNHHIIQCNHAFCTLVNLPEEQINGRACWEVVHKTVQPFEACPEQSMRQTLHRQTQEFAMGARWFEAIVDPVLDAEPCLYHSYSG
jgi:PAS domain S-box-containing protein